MKYLSFFTAIIFFSILLFSSCKSDGEDARNQAVESVAVPPPGVPVPSTQSTPVTSNASGVKHYTCPNNCAGSGGDAAGACPVCGTAYEHNQAFHNNTATPPPAPATATTPANTTTTITPPPAPTTPEPAQNAAGVWHYTCGAGCAGGAGAAGTCASCGGALAHNQAYHQ